MENYRQVKKGVVRNGDKVLHGRFWYEINRDDHGFVGEDINKFDKVLRLVLTKERKYAKADTKIKKTKKGK